MSDELRVYAVDDQAPFLDAAARVIEATAGFRLVGRSSSGTSALAHLRQHVDEVDLVLLDIELGDVRGTEVARDLAAEGCDLAVAYLSMLDEDDLADELGHPGVVGFLRKAGFGPDALHDLRPAVEQARRLRDD